MAYNTNTLKYPIGKFIAPKNIDSQILGNWIDIIHSFPNHLKKEVLALSDLELQKTYRPNGWSIQQIIHHCADSHMNSFIRFKLALTENTPIIKPYAEDLWAELVDTKKHPINSSIIILEGLHNRWVTLLKNMTQSDLDKEFIHPETNEHTSIKNNIGHYAWHCEHHLAHIKIAKMN